MLLDTKKMQGGRFRSQKVFEDTANICKMQMLMFGKSSMLERKSHLSLSFYPSTVPDIVQDLAYSRYYITTYWKIIK
jgi:hypothetical protein